ncbi:MAG: protein kinase [Sandaracinaceae bacterium]|nr:protein kinase [Sandaracinaceae bacterium]
MSEQLPQPGDLIGVRYRIESLLGQGGMGAVYAALNQATGRAVAIKWMLPGAARSKESLARFLAEARATAKIEHPNVIQILDVGQDGDAPFLVMERLRGESLADRLERGPLGVEETLDVMIDACKGVHEAHLEGIIHRDLKPDNIFLCQGKDGSKRPPKVLDFGISKLYDDDTPGAPGGGPMTKTGIAMGTPWYMSPEQINAAGNPDGRYDVYAMGVVLYECLAGRPPYDADGLFELVQQIAAGQAPPLRLRAPQCPPDLEHVVARAMAANRDYRHPSMKDLVADLEGIRARMRSGQPAPQIPQTGAQAYHTPPPMGSNSGPYSQPGHYATPASGGYGTPPPQTGSLPLGMMPTGAMHPPSGPMMHQAPPSSGSGKGLAIGLGIGLLAVLFLSVLGVGGAIYAFSGDDDDSGGGGGGGIAGVGGGGGGGGFGGIGGGEPEANPRDPSIDVTFSGACSPTFNARRMVTGGGGNVNVMSSNMGGLTGAVYMGFPGGPGTYQLSTQQRMDTQTAINVMVGQSMWTNMTTDVMAVRNGRIADPVSGSVEVRSFDSDLATADVTFTNVTLQNMSNGSICTLNGRLQARGTTYGM